VKAKSLQDLGMLKKTIEQQAQKEAEEKKAKELTLKKSQAEKNLFQKAVGHIQPIQHGARVDLSPDPPKPKAQQQLLDEQSALRESMSDEFDVSTLLDTDGDLSYSQTSIGANVIKKLRKGDWSLQGQIDLHGLRSDEAREALSQFIKDSVRKGVRCVRVVHGKGLGSPGKTPVLKNKVLRWLIQKNEVLAFVQAKPAEGGAGALLVLLRGG